MNRLDELRGLLEGAPTDQSTMEDDLALTHALERHAEALIECAEAASRVALHFSDDGLHSFQPQLPLGHQKAAVADLRTALAKLEADHVD